ncbi:type VII secretion protein EccCb [Mycolicibacterium smegmatis]|uniref:ESX-1 secretion system protein EccCb1 n=1 Tax=Mycolicibacterium smegmatis (strain ATCC 700084 / mc(2)155) TaxID=246196 RepID=ECC1B_MYCS2|nr:type VII secretion protein EccCb [Mycolicibacterium smegmatis]A0QNJ2.1 RecName: Full=ESX-1 secretion system protein EccCb1 [Mycolicibacterium smegmatis MC2 155]ABK71362.1 ftsk/spoiiie family protein [Mycolicibacterium smegmatis MC2 155]AFP36545.1 cell division FtsK/SpoIIIE [Mycolicibacterium smegmatis MC2 155]AIU05344.1 peptidase S49 [Mycolicibacterium smegmatis MC2 155]AIU11969.1 peptidase S49 [Mycolicibacterium smegmatis]AIU18593.1 peptidase S49 [Mycolicibacterium smegmatis]
MSTEAEPRVLREVVLSQLATGESRAYKMWLPPLTDPTPVNELVERDYQRRPLRFGLGIMDEPRRHRQEVWGVDVSAAGGNIAVGGAPQTGKSTFLQTLVVSAAATHTPRQVQFYCVDLGGGGLMYLEDLPHVGGVATRAEPDRVNRVVAEVKAVLRAREQVFKQYRVGSIASYREMRDDPNNPASQDPFGDVFLVIDGWPAFVAEFPDLEPAVQDIAGQGLAYGVHVIITTPRWTELKSRVRDYLGTKIEFRLGDVNETQIDRITREIPANRPGRAVSLEKHHLMMGVPRLDGVHSADNIVEAISSAVQQIADRHTDQAPQVRVLPERIYLHQLDPNPPGPDSDYRTRWQVPLGVRESDLTVAYNQMHLTPHLLIFGAPKSGKTRIAHAVAQAICKRNSPQQVRFMLADYRSGLLDAVPQSHLLDAGAINRNSATLEEAIKALAVNLKKRLPPPDLTTAQLRARSWWSGPDVVLLVDDWHMVTAAAGMVSPMAPLGPLLPAAADIGLHVIVTCQMSMAHRATMDKFVGAAYGAGSPTLFLSGEKNDFPSRDIIVKKRPPGQAFLVGPDGKEVIQAAYVDPPEEEVFSPPSEGS